MEEEKLTESMHMENLSQFPCLKEGDLVVTGLRGVMTYLNIKGKAPTIHPRKARVLAMQQYWIQVLNEKFEPLLDDITNRKSDVEKVLGHLDSSLKEKDYIVDEFTLADIHWAAAFKSLIENGQSDVISGFENIKTWLERIKSEIPSFDAVAEKAAA